MTPIKYVIFASYGNDSIALIQYAKERKWKHVHILYSDTGWAARWWADRVAKLEGWVKSLGFTPHIISSIGMENLVFAKKGWPRQGMQFCTEELKVKPAMAWLAEYDPSNLAICSVGVRREESKSRANFAKITYQSPAHGGRTLYAPLVYYDTVDRDKLIVRAGFDPLPHRSKECFPCINSNREDILLLAQDQERVKEVQDIEDRMGFTSTGKKRTIFRPASKMGAVGIQEVVRWAKAGHGKFTLDDGTGYDCEGGYCGT